MACEDKYTEQQFHKSFDNKSHVSPNHLSAVGG